MYGAGFSTLKTKKSPRLAPRGKVGWWRNLLTVAKVHEFVECIHKIVSPGTQTSPSRNSGNLPVAISKSCVFRTCLVLPIRRARAGKDHRFPRVRRDIFASNGTNSRV